MGISFWGHYLPIKEIVRHPNYKIVRGDRNSQFVENDVAVIKVDDEILRNPIIGDRINPACLPTGNKIKFFLDTLTFLHHTHLV